MSIFNRVQDVIFSARDQDDHATPEKYLLEIDHRLWVEMRQEIYMGRTVAHDITGGCLLLGYEVIKIDEPDHVALIPKPGVYGQKYYGSGLRGRAKQILDGQKRKGNYWREGDCWVEMRNGKRWYTPILQPPWLEPPGLNEPPKEDEIPSSW